MKAKYYDPLKLQNRELKGFFMLYVILLIAILVPFCWQYIIHPSPIIQQMNDISNMEKSKNQKKFDSTFIYEAKPHSDANKAFDRNHAVPPTPFNLLTLNESQAKRIGMPDAVFQRLNRYKSAGGKVSSLEDLRKIYGMTEQIMSKITPLLYIPQPDLDPAQTYKAIPTSKETFIVDIQLATESDLEKLPCIGERLASRIIKFRNALGGMYDVKQLKEVYGISDSCYLKIIPQLICQKTVNKINLNSITKNQLEKHPYFRNKMSKVIFDYIDQHDSIQSIEQLHSIYALDESWIEKVKPYLEFNSR